MFAEDVADATPAPEDQPLASIMAAINGGKAQHVPTATELLEDWLARDVERHIDEIRVMRNGETRVRLVGRAKAYGIDTPQGIEHAVRTALNLAILNGER